MISSGASPKKPIKSILKQTNGNDDNYYPAWGTSLAAGRALEGDEETKRVPNHRPADRQPEAFTEEPASANQRLMDFEAQLFQKAGKKAPEPKPEPVKKQTVSQISSASVSTNMTMAGQKINTIREEPEGNQDEAKT